jgi:hypothetical protein
MLNFSPRLRDALTRGFWIEEEMLTQRTRRSLRTESPDAGRGADAERECGKDCGRVG